MQYEDFKLIVKYRGVGNVSEHVYNLVKKHHSVRKFKNKPLSEDVVKKLVEAGQSASTSSLVSCKHTQLLVSTMRRLKKIYEKFLDNLML